MKKILLSFICCMLAVIGMQAQSYVKVTSAPADWSGDYLIVYEAGNVAFNGGLSTLDAVSNTIPVTISEGEIEANATTNAAKFTIESVTGGYAIKSASGKYIGVSSNSNGLKTTTSTTYKHSLSLDASANASIKAEFTNSTMALRYNKASDQKRFRYFKNAGQQPIALYKYTESGGGEDDTTPVLEANVDALEFKTAPGTTTAAQTIELTTNEYTGAVSYACDNAAFTVTDKGDNTYDVTFTAPAAEGTTTGKLTFSANGVDDVTVALTGVSTNSTTDVLNTELIGSGSGYTDWSGKTGTSGAVYAGNSYLTNTTAIQLKSGESCSGIVTTTSGGVAKSVTVVWGSGTTSGRTLDVYGKNSAYSSAKDLYSTSTSTKGTKIGSIKYGTSTTLTIDDEYEYIGLRSNSGAMYLTEIQIEWGAAVVDPTEVEVPTFNPGSCEVKRGDVITITSAEGTTLWYTVNGVEYEVNDTTANVIIADDETIIEAKAVKGEYMSEVATATYTVKKLAAPIFSHESGEVPEGTKVTITTTEPGATIVYTINGVEYESAENTAIVTIDVDTDIEAYAAMEGCIKSDDVTRSYTIKEAVAPGSTVEDVLTADRFVATSTRYEDFAGVMFSSDAVYAGNNSKTNTGAIQLRSTDDSGIVTTTTGGIVKSVTVTWDAATKPERVMDVYGKNTPYASAADLYSTSTQGTKLGSIACGESTLTIDGEYEYIGLRSHDGAMYVTDVTIEWYVPYEENVTSNNCYAVVVGNEWDEPEGCWYAAKFINKNTDAYTWAAVCDVDNNSNGYIFYLAAGNTPVMRAKAEDAGYTYTHIEFVQLPASVDVPANIQEIDLTGVDYKTTGEIYYDKAYSTTYSIVNGEWLAIGTGVEGVEVANGIAYANGVVTAEGAIEVYNIGGAVVARGNNNVDLNGLNGGVYIVRCGEGAIKVVR